MRKESTGDYHLYLCVSVCIFTSPPIQVYTDSCVGGDVRICATAKCVFSHFCSGCVSVRVYAGVIPSVVVFE